MYELSFTGWFIPVGLVLMVLGLWKLVELILMVL